MSRRIHALALVTALLSSLASAAPGDKKFQKARLSVLDGKDRETNISLELTDVAVVIAGRERERPEIHIPYASIDRLLYEFAQHRRVSEGAVVAAISPVAGLVTMLTKTKSHWLSIQHHQDNEPKVTVLRLHKDEYKAVLAELEARSGRTVDAVAASESTLDPTADSKDVDTVMDFPAPIVREALKASMEQLGCRIAVETTEKLECKRERGFSDRTGGGGEKVTATVAVEGERTNVRIHTGKGFVGRVHKRNWSTPIYQEALRRLTGAGKGGR
jgi:hypothetical protein